MAFFIHISLGCTCVPHAEPPSHRPPHSFPQGHPNARALSALSHAPNLDWRSISLMVISWSWNSNNLVTWCEEVTHYKRPWCWERLRAGGEGDNRGWNGWMASSTQWTWIWVDSGSWWCKGRPGVLRFMGSQRVGHDWATELNWIYMFQYYSLKSSHPFSHRIPKCVLYLCVSFAVSHIGSSLPSS